MTYRYHKFENSNFIILLFILKLKVNIPLIKSSLILVGVNVDKFRKNHLHHIPSGGQMLREWWESFTLI